MRTSFCLLIVLVLLSSGARVFAQNKPADFGCWPIYFGAAAINDRWGLWGEAQYRSFDFAGDLEQLLLRTAVTYNLDEAKNVQVAQGYAYARSEPYYPGTETKYVTEEHRLYQQLSLRQRWGRLYLQHRYRLEERFRQDDFSLRFRYFLFANLCLNKPSLEQGTVYLSAYNEIFISNKATYFDRNRIFGGVGYGFSKSFRLEVGPMWQQLATTGRPQLVIQAFHNFKL